MTQAISQPAHTLSLSELAPRVVQSEIRAMTAECDRMGGVNLAQGVCDTEVPAVVMEGAIGRCARATTSIRGWMGSRGCEGDCGEAGADAWAGRAIRSAR